MTSEKLARLEDEITPLLEEMIYARAKKSRAVSEMEKYFLNEKLKAILYKEINELSMGDLIELSEDMARFEEVQIAKYSDQK